MRWAEREGFEFDFLTQYDLHNNPDCLSNYDLAVIVGHDEYWSWEMRDAVDNFVENGGRLARFGANFIWQIRIENNGKNQVCYKLPELDPVFNTDRSHLTTTVWDSVTVNRLGTETMGLTGLGGAYARFAGACPRSTGALTVYRPEHWAFEKTDLYYADQVGGSPAYIVSYEVDGVDYVIRGGLPYPTGKDGAPESLEILAMSPTAGLCEDDRHDYSYLAPQSELMPLIEGIEYAYTLEESDIKRGSAMMVVLEKGKGEIFNAGMTEWVSGLIREDRYVEQITRNVLNRYIQAGG